jgi:hypothetical protein
MTRALAIDWSGRARGAASRLVLAEVGRDRGLRVESGRGRREVISHLLDLRSSDEELVVGLDFAFSAPAWFLRSEGCGDVSAFWKLVEERADRWLESCPWPFWGRPHRPRPALPAHLRRTEAGVPTVAGIRPKSVFQIGGAGAVGTSSLRGMPHLLTLRDAGFAVWPFDAPRLPLVVELYPRLLTGAVHKSDARDRSAYLRRGRWHLEDEARARAVATEDAFDAAVSALVMSEEIESMLARPAAEDEVTMLEGAIWSPTERERGSRNGATLSLTDPSRTGARDADRRGRSSHDLDDGGYVRPQVPRGTGVLDVG